MGVNPLVDVDVFGAVFRTSLKMSFFTKKLSGQITISVDHPPVLLLDPDGSARDVLLPAEGDSKGLLFYIYNTAGGQPEIISVKDDSDTDTILALDQNEVGLVHCDGTTWRGFSGFSADITATIAELNILDGVTATAAELNYVDVTTPGTVQANKAIVLGSTKTLIWTTTSSATVDPISFTSTMTGAGTTGGRALFRLNIEAALGGWSNALKAHAVYNAAGRTVGLGSALVAELQLSAFTGTGHYAPLESEVVVPSGASVGQGTSFIYMNVSDDGTTFNDDGFLFELGAGVVSTSGGLFDTIAEATVASTHSLKVMIGNTAYYIPLNTSQAF